MSIFARVPPGAVARKPAHGAPCNRCGVCCMATLCDLGQHVFNRVLGPCPALEWEDATRSRCGLIANPQQHAPERALAVGAELLGEAATTLIASATGCDARINGEKRNMAFVAAMDEWDVLHAPEVNRAMRLWGIKRQ